MWPQLPQPTESQRFAALGARVSGWDLDTTAISDDPAFSHVSGVDVTDEASVTAGFAASRDALGDVTVLVANAGVNGATKPTWEYSLEEWNHVINVDLTGVFLSSRPAVSHMREKGYGRIANSSAPPSGASELAVR